MAAVYKERRRHGERIAAAMLESLVASVIIIIFIRI
jgi:hypothetical protein